MKHIANRHLMCFVSSHSYVFLNIYKYDMIQNISNLYSSSIETSLHKVIWEDGRVAANSSSNGWGTVSHVRRKVPIGYNGALQIRPQKYPFPWTDPQTPLPASSLDPSDVWSQTESGSDTPFFYNALDRPTDAQTDRSSTGKFDDYRPLTKATRPNNNNKVKKTTVSLVTVRRAKSDEK